VLSEALEISRDEMVKQGVKVSLSLPENSPICFAVANHLHLAILTILLNLTDAIGEAGGGELTIKMLDWPKIVQIEFIVKPAIHFTYNLEERSDNPETIESQVGMISGFSPVEDAIAASGGRLNWISEDLQTTLKVELPKNDPD
jgi:hypothetical protein